MKIAYEPIYISQSESLTVQKYSHTSKCSSVSWHLHTEYEIVHINNGQGDIQIGTHHEKYTDGTLIFLAPNIPHMPFGNSQFKNNKEVVIHFSESFISEKLACFPEFNSILKFIKTTTNAIIFPPETHKKLASLFSKCVKQSKAERLLSFITILHQFSISENKRSIVKNKFFLESNKHSIERISKVYQYINNKYDQEIRSEILAKELGLTPNSFCRMFKAATNRNFIDFLNEFRIKKAQEHFDNFKYNDSTISEVMYLCGFNDPSYFSKQFKKYTGMTPSTYIKLLQQSR